MGKRISQIILLTKKNFLILLPRKIGILVELLIPFVILFGISFTRDVMGKESTCMGSYRPVDPFDDIWSGTSEKGRSRSFIGIAPNTNLVQELAAKMLELKVYGLYNTSNTNYTAVQLKTLTAENYTAELTELVTNKAEKYLLLIPTVEIFDKILETSSGNFRAGIYVNETGDDIKYRLRYHQSDTYDYWRTTQAYNLFDTLAWTGKKLSTPYVYAGYVRLQQLIDNSILLLKGAPYIPTTVIRSTPTPQYTKDLFSLYIQPAMIPLVIMISSMIMAASIATDIVTEKCCKMREVMRMMGLTDPMMWVAWYIQRSFFIIFLSVTITIVLMTMGYYNYSDWFLVLVFLVEYYVSLVVFLFFLTSLMRNAKVASFFMCVMTYMSYVPYDSVSDKVDSIPRGWKMLMCIFPLSGVNLGINVISDWEDLAIGARWSNLGQGPSSILTFTVGDVMGMLLIDIIIYSLLHWYIENVFPGEFGVPNKPYFMFTASYWKDGTSSKKAENGSIEKEAYEDPTCHEKLPENLSPGILIRNLNKTFPTVVGPKVAVSKLSMEMFEGQITALLGHNGAGKTTTINMLTGMYPPTSGDAVLGGHSILTNMRGIRESMGICPQHDILFTMMTVQQHLDFFIRLKGEQDSKVVREEVELMLTKLKLEDKRDVVAKKLSGGMKRKLSVGIALCGNSKTVMLDEPTTGMDASARRELWDMLLDNKEGRTIIFTTHSMDEADLLGDRIAIMAAGQLICSGSSLFLKRKYGVGYHLTLVKEEADMTDEAIDHVTKFIQRHVPSGVCNSNVGSELSYLLSSDDIDHFVALFQELEENSAKYGISSFGVSLTTMEEVFMKAGEGRDSNVKAIKDTEEEKKTHKIRKFDHSEMNTGATLLWQQFRCQFMKRFIQAKRSKMILIAQIALPIFFMIIGLTTYVTVEKATTGTRVLTLLTYPNEIVNAKLYFADLRSAGAGTYTAAISAYLGSKLSADLEDVSANSSALKNSYLGDTDSCCQNPYLQLNATCIDELVPTKYQACYAAKYDKVHFTYQACQKECFLCNGTSGCESCTVKENGLPIAQDLEEDLNYYQNYFMKQAASYSGNFYVDVQGGLTFSDRSEFYKILNGSGDVVYSTNISIDQGGKFASTDDVMTSWVSYKGLHLVPAFQNMMTNLLFLINDQSTRVEVTNDPLPESLTESFTASVEQGDMVIVISYIFCVSFLIASFAVNPVDERVNKSKHLQQISGVNPSIYWLGALAWDYINYLVAILLVYILIMCFGIDGFSGDRAGALLLIFMLEGIAILPVVYVLSHLFSKSTSAFGVVTTFMFLITTVGYVMYTIVYSLYELEGGKVKTDNKYSWILTVDNICLLHPHYAATAAMGNLLTGYTKQKAYDTCLTSYPEVYCKVFLAPTPIFDMSSEGVGIGRHVVALLVVGVVVLGALLAFETHWCRIRAMLRGVRFGEDLNQVSPKEDERVKQEREKVYKEQDQLIESKAAVMIDLHKRFGQKVAVKNISLALEKGECFGLLGVNGAGKTTTFNMMTGDMASTSGEGYLYSYNVNTQIRKAQKFMGYCPQFDALIGNLTGRELLTMFANLRGVPEEAIPASVEEVITIFNLEDHADKECGTYSGGNKRKLSTGIAIIGSPPLIFLDEPTSGMDPTARRFLWDVLCFLRQEGCSIVLTSHSMEECEALCTRLVIMVNGSNRCLGSIQQLKSTYSQGFTVCLVMEPDSQLLCQSFIEEHFQDARLKETHRGYLMYSLGTAYRWSHIFDLMQRNKAALGLLDYSVSQTSLEQVFLNFAKEQIPDEKKKTCLEKVKACLSCNQGNTPPARIDVAFEAKSDTIPCERTYIVEDYDPIYDPLSYNRDYYVK